MSQMCIENGKSLNKFKDSCAEFIQSFSDSRRFKKLATLIVHTLSEHATHMSSPDHPYHRFGDVSMNLNECIQELAYVVKSDQECQNPDIRSIIKAFFNTNGSAREDTEELMKTFLEHVDVSFHRSD